MPAQKTKTLKRKRAKGMRWTAYYNAARDWRHCEEFVGCGTYSTEEEADTRAMIAWEEAQKPGFINPKAGKENFAIFAETEWPKSLRVTEKTRGDYLAWYRNHVKPYFAGKSLSEITELDVEQWIVELEKNGVGRTTQRAAHGVLSRILGAAVKKRLIHFRVTTRDQLLPVPPPPVKIFSRKTFADFLLHVDEYWQPLVRFASETGLRADELRALTPSQIRPMDNAARITIDRVTVQVDKVDRSRVTDDEDDGESRRDGGATRLFQSQNRWFEDHQYTKNRSIRVIKVPLDVFMIIAPLIKARGLSNNSTERIFLNRRGNIVGAQEIIRFMDRAHERSQREHKRSFKHLRSSHVSWMLKETGGDIAAVMVFHGHTQIATTQKYVNAFDDEELETTETGEVIDWDTFLDQEDPATPPDLRIVANDDPSQDVSVAS